ncbi:MAG: hypothetical protein K5872_12580 [Rhizobiaceae bacterium]|nr:hypothetical protein [Rhizobiaceae bacterium]MCV0407052.1 hypothetical protein [Rhizobiaceae bacterium]
MIERYFKKGVCLQWTKPPNVDSARDGQFHHREQHSSPMTYNGLAGHFSAWDPVFSHTQPAALGFTKNMRISHKWLDYRPGASAKCHLGSHDVLTGFMSGCPIVTWQDGGRWVGHIGTTESDPRVNTLVKTTARGVLNNTATGFNPAAAWGPGQLATLMADARKNTKISVSGGMAYIVALVTTTGDFYSIALMNDVPNSYIVLGCQRVPPMNNAALMNWLN